MLHDVRDWIWRKPGTFTVQRCAGCGLVMTRPRPDPDALAWYYEGAYSGQGESARSKREGATNTFGQALNGYRLHVLSKVRRPGPDDQLLDVGCSYGGFLWLARQRTGCRTAGVDLDEGSVREALDPDQTEYRAGTLLDAAFEPQRFDLITFYECLEHDPAPVETLREAHRVLAPGGVVAVEVPNFEGLWRRVFGRYWMPLLMPQHLIHFTPDTLRAALEAAGFQVVHRQTMWFPLEGVASYALWMGTLLRVPPAGSPPSWRTPFDLLFGLSVVVLWFVAELPTQLLLWATRHTGHVTMIARKAAPDQAPPDTIAGW
ncbi:MAG: class I SAM-dependent methyltransferase [Alphaproteobacteria bacterium]|nr:class I SAM-dependent methyltransferase [Alphaproteobacteria bacterium]